MSINYKSIYSAILLNINMFNNNNNNINFDSVEFKFDMFSYLSVYGNLYMPDVNTIIQNNVCYLQRLLNE